MRLDKCRYEKKAAQKLLKKHKRIWVFQLQSEISDTLLWFFRVLENMRVSKHSDYLLLKTHYFFSSAIFVCSSLPGIFQNNPVVIHFSLPAQKQLILCDIQNGSVQDLSYTGVAEGLKRRPETPGCRSCVFPAVFFLLLSEYLKCAYYKNNCLLRYKRQCCFENG